MHTTLFENKKIAAYLQEGVGIPMVFVHGFCEDSSVWNDFIIPFAEQTIVRVDLPGFGNSERIENASMERFSEVVQVVLEGLEIKECFFIGHSMGGYVALEFAKKYPTFLKGLCLFHSHPYADTPEKIVNRKKSIDFINKNGPIYYVKQLIPNLFTPNFRNNNHLELAKLVFSASKYSAESITSCLEAMTQRKDHTEVLQTIKIPYLFIIGKEDMVVPDYTKDMALADVADIHILKNVAHMGMFEKKKACVQILKVFLKFLESGQD